MNLEEYLHNATTAMRKATLDRTNQMTLGELIAKLEGITPREGDNEQTVEFDFEFAFPTELGSWRGAYDELALGFDFVGYGLGDFNKGSKPPKLTDFIAHLKEAIGKEFYGWKGGDYVMSKTTPVWVANDGNSGNTAIKEVVDDGYRVILMTEYCEY